MSLNFKPLVKIATITCFLTACGGGGGSSKGPQSNIPAPPVIPNISIEDVTVTEGNEGTTDAVFTVTLDQATTNTVTVDYATSDDTAIAGEDYVAASGTLTFDANITSQQITVLVNGDTLYSDADPTEYFNIALSNASIGSISTSMALGKIENDDLSKVEAYKKLRRDYVSHVSALPDAWFDYMLDIDLDADNDKDVIMFASLFNDGTELNMVIFRNKEGAGFEQETTEYIAGSRGDHIVADFNGDGLEDLYWSDSGYDELGVKIFGAQERLFIQQDNGSLLDVTSTHLPEMILASHSTCSSDIDNDGDIDIYAGGLGDPRILVNDGTGVFNESNDLLPLNLISAAWIQEHRHEPGVIADMMPSFSWCEMSDFNKDGNVDLILGSNNNEETMFGNGELIGQSHVLLINDGVGNMQYTSNSIISSSENTTVEMIAVDYDLDTCTDLATLNTDYNNSTKLTIFKNDCQGSFDIDYEYEQTEIGGLQWVNSLNAKDINGDGYTDITGFYTSILFSENFTYAELSAAKTYLNDINASTFTSNVITESVAVKIGPVAFISLGQF